MVTVLRAKVALEERESYVPGTTAEDADIYISKSHPFAARTHLVLTHILASARPLSACSYNGVRLHG